MDFRHLRTFVTVADLGTVSKAAAQLGVAQPALSRQIKDLETDLGVTLFDRVRRRLILTSDGQVLLSECRNALGTLSSIRDRAQLLRRPDSGVRKVAATPQTIDGVLSTFLARYAKHRPNVQIRLNEAFGAELLALLERGEAHVVITTGGAHRSEQQAVRHHVASAARIRRGVESVRGHRRRAKHGRAGIVFASRALAEPELRRPQRVRCGLPGCRVQAQRLVRKCPRRIHCWRSRRRDTA